jgi:hypothetical protein
MSRFLEVVYGLLLGFSCVATLLVFFMCFAGICAAACKLIAYVCL